MFLPCLQRYPLLIVSPGRCSLDRTEIHEYPDESGEIEIYAFVIPDELFGLYRVVDVIYGYDFGEEVLEERGGHVGKAPVELQVLEIHPLVDVLYGRVAHPEVIRRVLDQPRRVDTRAVVGGDHLGGVGLALLEDVVKGVLELGDLEEGEVRDALEAVARIREIAVCQHPGHNAMPDVDS